jgi:beta-amyrin synthase
MQEDLYYSQTWMQDLFWDSIYILIEPVLTRWPFNKLRNKALQVVMKHIHYEDENSRYLTIGGGDKVTLLFFFYLYIQAILFLSSKST